MRIALSHLAATNMYDANDIRARIDGEARRGDWQTVAEITGMSVKTVYAVTGARRENQGIINAFGTLLDERKARLAAKATTENIAAEC